MTTYNFLVESKKPFSESVIWQMNREFYQQAGIAAWSENIVPHQMTSNSLVGKTYAELIFAFLKDLNKKKGSQEIVYILELGAGHGRLAFHVLKHLEALEKLSNERILKYCYVLSDIVEENLSFFLNHPQFEKYYKAGKIDVSYFDAVNGDRLELRYSGISIHPQSLSQPIIAIANYFFDSIPTDLFYIKDKVISKCSLSIQSNIDPQKIRKEGRFKEMEMTYHKEIVNETVYEDHRLNEILNAYKFLLSDTHLFFPQKSIQCLDNLKSLSSAGLMLLTMDKGYHQTTRLDHKSSPDIVAHGSFSLWVNYHALGAYCAQEGGMSLFPSFSNFHLELGCLLFGSKSDPFFETKAAYEKFVNNFGPDDFMTIKKLAYTHIATLNLKELIALFRLSAYDSSFFIKLLPRVKQLSLSLTLEEKERLVETLNAIWNMYFHINESFDLAFELGGIFYDVGHYSNALELFQYSIVHYGDKVDSYHNQALCFYQLREDDAFLKTVNHGITLFPENIALSKLLDLEI
ncbi:SAM-dependent methyltransferase [Portibacter marinus]|uniref:SAM-dependent methyltransferase n=1 Tax=Portibacter marinus TaxID=2898660 RepID=UPI001F218965|nr:SAM-dependent methyltransferase [Portibacter marinus]